MQENLRVLVDIKDRINKKKLEGERNQTCRKNP
jgi:hypothetical protein